MVMISLDLCSKLCDHKIKYEYNQFVFLIITPVFFVYILFSYPSKKTFIFKLEKSLFDGML